MKVQCVFENTTVHQFEVSQMFLKEVSEIRKFPFKIIYLKLLTL